MATATFSGQYGRNMTLEVWSAWNRQDIASNSSTVNVQARLITNGYASMWGVTADLTATINGVSAVEHPAINIGTGSSQLIFARDYNVPHNSDGTKTVGIKISVGLNAAGYGSSTVSFDLPLPRIPRASTISDVNGTLGSAMTVNINRKNSAFKHTVKYNFGALSGTIATNVDTSVSWIPPLNLATAMPNRTSDWGNITVETYNGSSKIGSATCRLTLKVPDSVKPTLGSITLTDSNVAVKNLLNTANTFAEIVSDIKVAFNSATGVQGSTITDYHAEIVNKNQSTNANNGNLGLMNWNGSAQVKAWVVDSRGRSSNAVTTNITVLEYFLPTLTFTAIRGDTNQSSDKIVVSRTAKIAPLRIGNTQKNSFKLSFKTAPFGSTTYTADTGAGVNDKVTNTLTNSKATLSGTFDIGKSYEVYGVLEDALTSSGTVKAPPVSPEKMVMGMAETAVSFGKYPEIPNAVDSLWPYYYNNQRIEFVKGGTVATLPDDLTTSGAYKLSTPTANLPALDQGQLLVIRGGGDTIGQIYMPYNESNLYIRTANNIGKDTPNWKAWTTFTKPNTVAEFTAVNQTKIYSTTLAGPYGLSLQARRVGNIVSVTLDASITSTESRHGTAKETIPSGWRPVKTEHIVSPGFAGGGTGTQMWTGESLCHLTYKSDGSIGFTIRATATPLAAFASVTWITSDPFPS